MKDRLTSLDFFRGATIAGMIVVNDPGSWKHVYAPLKHAEWHGVTATDLVFPFFLFIVGVSIALSYTKQLALGREKGAMAKKAAKRAAIIFLLGMLLTLFPKFDFANLRLVGVLPRIALVFLACSLMFIYMSPKRMFWIGAGLLLFYWLVMMYIPLPGVGEVMLEPGQNMAAWIDGYITPGRMYRTTWDPEGLFSTLPAIASGLSGIAVGLIWLRKETDVSARIMWMFTLGFVYFFIGNIWGWFFPMNKHIWTSSYVLHTSGLAAMGFAASIVIIDVMKIKTGTKMFVVFGLNAIAAYVLHGLLFKVARIFTGEGPTVGAQFTELMMGAGLEPKLASLSWALLYLAICYVPIYALYRKGVFIKV
ncbi:MAG: DUF5009 domain-containing protein [Saprospiraceae bacterium]|nr:DUF5009 domain-containing protein [Saprospiraceae bacterium]